MKIGLLTFQDTNNIGACLQALALYTKIKNWGYDIEIINYHNERIYYNEVVSWRPRLLPIRRMLIWLLFGRKNYHKYKSLQKEFSSLARISDVEYTLNDIKQTEDKYDCFLVGSDQVWALNLTDYDYTYFLDFVGRGKRKISFSSSISDEESFSKDKHAQSLLKEFDRISVREKEAQIAIQQTIGLEVEWVGDPTMLLTTEEWDQILSPREYKEEYIFIYFLDPQKKILKDALDYAKKHKCKAYFCNIGKPIRGIKNVVPKTMSEWIGLIKHSKAVFTASYHGMLFALYYQKQFLFYNRNQKSRMISLSCLTGTESNDGELYKSGEIPYIDYTMVSKRIESFRNKSADILKETMRYGTSKQ